jgi:hypothetical protein
MALAQQQENHAALGTVLAVGATCSCSASVWGALHPSRPAGWMAGTYRSAFHSQQQQGATCAG